MTEANAPRMRRPSWRDPRLGIGILLVVASVALGSWVVSQADATVPVYQTQTALTPGDVVEIEELAVVQVRLDDVSSTYLVPGAEIADGAVITRTVGAGELLPIVSIGDPDAVKVRPLEVPMSASLQDVVEKGSRVDLWVSRPDTSDPSRSLEPESLVVGVEVRDVYTDDSVFAGGTEVQIQVLVPETDVSAVLAAIAAGGEITVVPFSSES